MSTDGPVPPGTLLAKDLKELKSVSLSETVDHLDKLLETLHSARDAAIKEPGTASLELAKIQNSVKSTFEAMNKSLIRVSKAQKSFGKALDKTLPLAPISNKLRPFPDRPDLVNRAISMHLLRAGQFPVVGRFLEESCLSKSSLTVPSDMISIVEPGELQTHFREMYQILTEIKKHNLGPAIDWTVRNQALLDKRQSTFMFDLVKLQFIWLCSGPTINGLPNDEHNGIAGAISYGRKVFPKFPSRYAPTIHRLSTTVIFMVNIEDSPYASLFDVKNSFADIAATFTREFCSLLGLSSESPLHMVVVAGTMSLPRLIKFEKIKTKESTEWSSTGELEFETPLPPSLMFHPIFVCPVMKEQTSETNPACLLPCGHVICRAAVDRLKERHTRFKCPYCPREAMPGETKEIRF